MIVYYRLREEQRNRMAYYMNNLDPFSITKCRAFYKTFVKSIGILFVLFSFFSHAATEQQIELIQKAAENHIFDTIQQPPGGELSVQAANIDSRVKASDCPQPLKTSASNSSNSTSNINVLVQCEADNWRIYVPVRLSISVPLVTATRSLSRGDLISQSDLTMGIIELHRFRRQGFSDPKLVIGAKLKKSIRPGEVVERGDVCIVCRNEKVVIRAVKSGMTITTKGTSLQDGSTGDQVRVKNDTSKRIIDGQVTGIAEVTIYF